jgi:methionyl-tRNA formyltransferase
MAADEETGVSVMRLVAELDAGPVALQESIPIEPDDDFESLSGRLQELGAELLVRALDLMAAGELRFEEQDEEGTLYAEKIAASERRLDPARPAAELERTVRALTPHIGAYLVTAGGKRLGVGRARAVEASVEQGEIEADWGALLLGCGEGALRLEVVQPEGGKAMAADAFLRGHALPRL